MEAGSEEVSGPDGWGFSLEVPAPGAVLYTGSIEGSDGLLRPAEYPGDSGD